MCYSASCPSRCSARFGFLVPIITTYSGYHLHRLLMIRRPFVPPFIIFPSFSFAFSPTYTLLFFFLYYLLFFFLLLFYPHLHILLLFLLYLRFMLLFLIYLPLFSIIFSFYFIFFVFFCPKNILHIVISTSSLFFSFKFSLSHSSST